MYTSELYSTPPPEGVIIIKMVEARGVEPLSPELIRHPSTCLTAL